MPVRGPRHEAGRCEAVCLQPERTPVETVRQLTDILGCRMQAPRTAFYLV